MVPSQEKAEEMITSMEEVVNSIVMATGLAQEIESEQKRIAAEEAVVEEEENDNGSEADGGGGKEVRQIYPSLWYAYLVRMVMG